MQILSSYAISTISYVFNAITQIIIVFTLAIFFSFEKDKVVFTIAKLSQTPKKTALKLKKLYFQL
jgi:predicted PurR-regulated permease PerM